VASVRERGAGRAGVAGKRYLAGAPAPARTTAMIIAPGDLL
jgi:hypothetical protein